MSSDPLKQLFKATVESSLDGLRTLVPLLEEERDALTQVDIEAIETVSQRKLEKLSELEHSVLAREHLQQQAGFKSGLEGGRELLREHFHPSEILSQWQELEKLSDQLQRFNDDNAKLALSGERHARQALGILTGRGDEGDTYSAKAKKALGGYSLGKC